MLEEYLKEKSQIIEEKMQEYFNELKHPDTLIEGMNYSVFNGGKRLRPILLLMTLEILDCDIKLGIPSAVAIEMIHSYSLVHDDLPALDNDMYRRGKLTTHKKFGEAQGILIGDSLLTHAFTILSKKNKGVISGDKIVDIIEKTSVSAGVEGMIGGQEIDLESENKQVELPVLQYIHTHKTGMLIRLPIEIAGIISECDKKKLTVLTEYADLIGLSFQIKDDILDVEGDFKKLGKTIGKDDNSKKTTYPTLFGIEKTKEMLDEKIHKAISIVDNEFGKKGKYLIELAKFIKVRDH